MSSPPTRSDTIDSVPAELEVDETGSSRIYHVYKPAFRRHYDIKSSSDEPLYYVNISSFTHNKPELTLHVGTNKTGPIIAASKFLKLSADCKLALGDPEDLKTTQWEDMVRESPIHSRYRFEMTIPSAEGNRHGERRVFLWKRTHSVKVEDTRPFPWSMRSFKMVDEKTGQVLAVFSRERSVSKCGQLQIRVEYGEDFDLMVLISGLSVFEKASGGGGGGGGG
ncbi:hypothetical protein PEBR_24264 [Penicillium brasilianum]|uniref:Uncharacterized protein n=1 Tax=Penicillium brasilianum TaxID=104259 RepID=A0A1S9RKP2_PENBI|nr:hypothetical protein PEBR_24264 [Penicillium brasilianum]